MPVKFLITVKKISELQDKAIRIINFKPKNYPVAELYKNNRNLKLTDFMKVKNTLTTTQILSYRIIFKKTREIHRHNTTHTFKDTVEIP